MTTTTKILAIETASEACSATLLISDKNGSDKGSQKMHTQIELTPRQHAKQILSMLDKVLAEGKTEFKDIDAIAFGRGPGAFTGLRIAAGVAQGVALSVDKSVIPVSTLAALALKAVDEIEATGKTYQGEIIATALDARMGEVYWGLFKQCEGKIQSLRDEQVSQPEKLLTTLLKTSTEMGDKQIIAVGAGWDAYAEEMFKTHKPQSITHLKNIFPIASEISKLALILLQEGKTVAPENAQPVYIRNNVAKKSLKQQ